MSDPVSIERMADGIVRLWLELQRRKESGVSSAELTTTQAVALRSLSLEGPQRIGALADVLGVTFATASRTIDALERAGLARREPDPGDARAVRVALTPAGRREHARRRQRFLDALAQLSDELSELERRRLVESLETLARVFDRRAQASATQG